MVELLYIQAVTRYHRGVFGIVETATVMKNKNDLIEAVQQQNLFPPTYCQCFEHKLYSSLFKNAQQENAAFVPTEDQWLPVGQAFKGHRRIIWGIQPQFVGRTNGHWENLEVIRGLHRLDYPLPSLSPLPWNFIVLNLIMSGTQETSLG